MEEWKTYKLGDIASMKYGKLPPKEQTGGKVPIYSGYRYVGVTDVSNCKEGTIIVVARGVGGTGDVKLVKEDCFLTNLSISVEINESICLSQYFYYKFYLNNLKYLDSGSAQSQITIEDLKRLELTIPPINEQMQVVSILKSIDDKIELNNRINHNLEEQADAIIASIIEENDCVSSLKDVAYYINDKTATTSYSRADYISTENMYADKSGVGLASNLPGGRATSFCKGDTLVSNIRPYFKKIWNASRDGICSNDILCFRTSTNTPSTLYHLLRQDSFFDYVLTGAKGSKMPRGDKDQIMKWNIPSISELCRFEKELTAMDANVIALTQENMILTEQRDSLLPLLISGEITC